jgi:hypothetical protein
MVNYICKKCNKNFKQKSHYINHTENKKNPCNDIDIFLDEQTINSADENSICTTGSTLLTTAIDTLITKIEENKDNNNCTCVYCNKIFTRMDNLQRHLNGRCKSKESYDELDKLKEDMKIIIQNYQKMESENVGLKKEIDEIKVIQVGGNINNENNVLKGNNNQINKGLVQNNTVNIQLTQFGKEDISKLNLMDAMKSYLKSTGGNIVSNMLKYINLNEQYPENNNICMTDLSREIVKIHNGKKFIYKKFKNVKDEILTRVVKNTRKIVENYESDKNLKKSLDTQNKIKINDVSLKIIDGVSGEDIVREEINENNRLLLADKKKNKKSNKKINADKNNETGSDISKDICTDTETDSDIDTETESEEEREFTFEERLRIEHLEKKREGLQKKTFENIKEELYNNREILL